MIVMVQTSTAIVCVIVAGVVGFVLGILTTTMILTAIAWTHKW